MATPPILRQLRHDVWATQRLIEHCRKLTDEQLGLTIPGTYGSIRRMFSHIIAADERYLSTFMGPPSDPVRDAQDYTLDELAARARDVAARVEELFAGKEFDPDKPLRDERRKADIEPWVLVTQFCHHGSDHRAQICSTLGANGLETPSIDVWAYARELGAFRPHKA